MHKDIYVAFPSTYDGDSLMLLLLTLLIISFLYRSIERASKVKRSLLYTKKKKRRKKNLTLEILDIL